MPAPTVVTDASNAVTQINIRWMAYDTATASYVEVNPADVNSIVSDSFIEITNPSGSNELQRPPSGGLITTSNTFNQTWKLTGGTNTNTMSKLVIAYSVGLVNYKVAW